MGGQSVEREDVEEIIKLTMYVPTYCEPAGLRER